MCRARYTAKKSLTEQPGSVAAQIGRWRYQFPNPAWMGAFQQVNAQGQGFADSPISPSGKYYAFLSKVDLDVENGLYDVLFEFFRNDWMDEVGRLLAVGIDRSAAPERARAAVPRQGSREGHDPRNPRTDYDR